ncbi:response regulator [Paenibacillus sp. YIM B09110]|uniref:response regulator n=1 Tax=Paenibacillus sp. YIM B09110 TaxID=3126102 RepID=UPI00301D1537
MKLLIADDQQSLHTFLDKMMNWQSLGITEIKHAYDGREAAELAEQWQPELLIIDIQMPHLNGIEALKQLQQLSHKPKTIILSAYDEFEYAREALRLSVAQYLLKPVDTAQLDSALKELIEELKAEQATMLGSAITSYFRQEQEQSGDEESDLTTARSAFPLLGIKRYIIVQMTGEQLHKDGLVSLLKRMESVSEIKVLAQVHSLKFAAVLGLTSDARMDELVKLGETAALSWQSDYPQCRVIIGLSSIGDTPEELNALLAQSSVAAASGFYSSVMVQVGSEAAKSEAWTMQHYEQFDKSFEEKFSLAFPQEAMKDIVAALFNVFRALRLESDQVYRLCKHYLTMAEQAMSRSKRFTTDNEPVTLERLRKLHTAAELESYFYAIIDSLVVRTDHAAERTEETITRIKSHIELHYEEDLSLQSVADTYGLDKYQLSRMFKQQFGINYWQYVTQIRMDKAAELLSGTNLKNSAIAEMTGFVDESHFSKTFKKHFGVSPKDYRGGKHQPPNM